jgi:hypothetical protein
MGEVRDVLDEHVTRKLEDSFGKAVALMIMASASNQAGVMSTVDLDASGYQRLIEAICSDDRVVGMWGRAGTEATLGIWRGLV